MAEIYVNSWNNKLPQFSSAAFLKTDVSGNLQAGTTLGVANGGTGATSLTGIITGNGASAFTAQTLTQYSVLLGGASNAITSLANGTTGQTLHAVTGANNPIWAAVSLTADVSGTLPIANGGTNATTFTTNMPVYYNGTSIVSSNIGVIAYNEVSGTSQAMAVNNEYCPQNGSLTTLTLPSTAVVGSTIKVTGKGAGGWKIAQNASQFINFLGAVTTTGATGYLQSVNQYACIELRCTTANNGWVVVNVNGNITVA